MDEKTYQRLTEEYGDMFDGPDTPERREWMMESMKRKYEAEIEKQGKQPQVPAS